MRLLSIAVAQRAVVLFAWLVPFTWALRLAYRLNTHLIRARRGVSGS